MAKRKTKPWLPPDPPEREILAALKKRRHPRFTLWDTARQPEDYARLSPSELGYLLGKGAAYRCSCGCWIVYLTKGSTWRSASQHLSYYRRRQRGRPFPKRKAR
jgi:hypothetical protein